MLRSQFPPFTTSKIAIPQHSRHKPASGDHRSSLSEAKEVEERILLVDNQTQNREPERTRKNSPTSEEPHSIGQPKHEHHHINPLIRPLERPRNCNPPPHPESQNQQSPNPRIQDRYTLQQRQTQIHTYLSHIPQSGRGRSCWEARR